MEQKYYVAENGDMCLSLTTHPGKLTEYDIRSNLKRMMILQAELDGEEEITWEDVSDEANRLYFDNEDRMIQLARPGDDLVPLESLGLSEEDLDNELWSMGIDLSVAWKFSDAEWE